RRKLCLPHGGRRQSHPDDHGAGTTSCRSPEGRAPMSSPPSLRRRWLLGALAFGTTSMWSFGPQAAPPRKDPSQRVRKKLVSLLREPERAREVGAVYRQERPAAAPGLANTVLAEMGPDAGSEATRRYIVARIRRELDDAQVINVDGWILSPTEAQ